MVDKVKEVVEGLDTGNSRNRGMEARLCGAEKIFSFCFFFYPYVQHVEVYILYRYIGIYMGAYIYIYINIIEYVNSM